MNNISLQEELSRYNKQYTIYQATKTRKDGVRPWCMAFYYEGTDGKKARKVISATDKSELETKRIQFLTENYHEKLQIRERQAQQVQQTVVTNPVYAAPPVPKSCGVTVRQAYEKFHETYKGTVAHATYLSEITRGNKVCRYLGNKLVDTLEFDDFQNLITQISYNEKGEVAPYQPVFQVQESFRRLLKYCYKKGWITREAWDNICEDVKIPTEVKNSDLAERTKLSKFRDFEQLGEILHVLEDNRVYYLTIRILLVTGLRPGEFLALKKSRLDRENARFYVEQAVTKNEKKSQDERCIKIGNTKNKGSKRFVPLPKELFRYFDELEELMVKSGRREKSYGYGNGDLVLVSERGTLLSGNTLTRNLRLYIKARSKTASITLGMPRHCYQELLDRLGAKDNDIERSVGHVLAGIGNKSYKMNEAYLERLLPYLSELDREIEKAYQDAKNRK